MSKKTSALGLLDHTTITPTADYLPIIQASGPTSSRILASELRAAMQPGGASSIQPGGFGLIGSGGNPLVTLAVRGSIMPGDAPTTSVNNTYREPKLKWLDSNTLILSYVAEDTGYNDGTSQWIAIQKIQWRSDGSVTVSDPVIAVTEADYGSGHHAINEYFLVVDQAKTIWIGYTRLPYGTAALNALTSFDTQTLWTKSTDQGNSFAAVTRFDNAYINQLLDNTLTHAINGAWSNDGTNYTITTASGDPWVTGNYLYITGVTDGGGSAVNNKAYRITRTAANAYTLTTVVAADGTESAAGKVGTPSGGSATPRCASMQISDGWIGSDGGLYFCGYWRNLPGFGGQPWPFMAKTTTASAFTAVTAYVVDSAFNGSSIFPTNVPIEPCGCETTPGSHVLWCRASGDGNAAHGGKVLLTLTSGDTTLKNPVYIFAGDSITLEGIDRLGDGRLVALQSAGNAAAGSPSRFRTNARIISPTGALYGKRTIHYATSWYNAVAVHPDGEQIAIAYEGGHTSQEASATPLTHISVVRTSATAILNAAGTLDEFIYDFDELPSGIPVPIVSGSEGAFLHDRGPLQQHATAFGAPTCTVDSNGTGMTFHSATSDYAVLAGANDSALNFDARAEDSGAFHIELTYKTAQTGGAFLGPTVGVGTAGVSITNAGGTPTLNVSDGTTSISAVWGSATNDGNKHTIIAERDPITAGSRQIRIRVDGGAWVTTPDTTATAAGSISNTTTVKRLNSNGVTSMDTTYYAPLRIVRGIPASSFPTSYTPVAKPYNAAPTPRANSPRALFTASQLLLHLFDQDGYGVYGARFENPSPVPPYTGRCAISQISADNNRYWGQATVVTIQASAVRDPICGWMWRTATGASPFRMWVGDARTQGAFDFIQQGGTPWTIMFRAKFNASVAGTGLIFSTKGAYGSGANGMQLVYDEGATRIYTTIKAGANVLADDNAAMPVISTANRYAIFISGTGNAASPITYHVVALTATQTLPSLGTAYTTANFTPLASNPAANPLFLFDDVDVYVNDFAMINNAWNDTGISAKLQAYCLSP